MASEDKYFMATIKSIVRSTKTKAYQVFEKHGIKTIEELSKLEDSRIEDMFRDSHRNAKNKAYEYRREAQMALTVLHSNVSPSNSIEKILEIDDAQQQTPVFTIDECSAILKKIIDDDKLIEEFKGLCLNSKQEGFWCF